MHLALLLVAALAVPASVAAQVRVENAWVRATVPAQKATGAFMTLTSPNAAALVSAASPIAAHVEVHESSTTGGVMQMRAVPRLALPANKAVELKPAGHHVMLIGLTKAVSAGEDVPIALTIEDSAGKRSVVNVVAKARPLTESGHAGKH